MINVSCRESELRSYNLWVQRSLHLKPFSLSGMLWKYSKEPLRQMSYGLSGYEGSIFQMACNESKNYM